MLDIRLSGVIDPLIAAFSVVGGLMAVVSGLCATILLWGRVSPEKLADGVNRGIAIGFMMGAPLGVLTFLTSLDIVA